MGCCDAWRAGTGARFPGGGMGCAECGSTVMERCARREGMWRAWRWIRSRRSPSITPTPGGTRSRSACWVAICIARTAQNWVSSQALRDGQAVSMPKRCTAEQLVDFAVRYGAPVMVSTYNEPLITADWAMKAFTLAKEKGIVCGFVSNGNATPEVLDYLRPCVDLYKVDLKTFDDRNYRRLGGVLSNVTSSIERLVEMKFWVEVVTLVVPEFNDTDGELQDIAKFLAGVSRNIPWHVTAFHPDYKMTGSLPARHPPRSCGPTISARLRGLHFVYPGNIHGGVGDRENTYCMDCGALLIRRQGFYVQENRMLRGKCTACGANIPGAWEDIPPNRATARVSRAGFLLELMILRRILTVIFHQFTFPSTSAAMICLPSAENATEWMNVIPPAYVSNS